MTQSKQNLGTDNRGRENKEQENLYELALDYHRKDPPGKLAVMATKPLTTQSDLALAYSPGVAAACNAIVDDESQAFSLTARGNLVGVVSNGTAVLGLGEIGPLASKPVMEGKAVLFKKFAGIDVFDIELDEKDPDKLIEVIAALAPTFGGINLEDIKAPECFHVEKALRERLHIPVFHDDQHGTAIIVAAAIINGLSLVNKRLEDIKLVSTGGGAAGIACLDLLVSMGLKRENIYLVDILGVVFAGRVEQMDEHKICYAQKTSARTLDEVIDDADVFLGLSAPGILKPDMVKRMGDQPLIMALANPDPEIRPEDALAVRPDAIMATGRSDYPNQVNNVLCFPYIFRGALDVGATTINEEMKIACVNALAKLARAEQSEIVTKAYAGDAAKFGKDKLIPRPFDPRLITSIAPAVAKAAMDSGVAQRPIEDFHAYDQRLTQFVFRSGFLMKPLFQKAKYDPKRLVFAEGEGRRVLQAVQQIVDDKLAYPILVGRPEIIARRIERLGLRLDYEKDIEIVNPQEDDRFRRYWRAYHDLLGRQGVSPEEAKTVVQTSNTVIAALMLHLKDADAMLCGTIGRFQYHLGHLKRIVGKAEGVIDLSTMVALVLPSGTFFICDTHITAKPSAEEIAQTTLLAADHVRSFGIEPKVALMSSSNFGSNEHEASVRMRDAVGLIKQQSPQLQVDGEMHADAALSQTFRDYVFPGSNLKGEANLFVMSNIDTAHVSYNLLKMLGGGVSIGPILLGARHPAHLLTNSVSVRGIVNMAAVAVSNAQTEAQLTLS
ncbi:MAG: NADP-dependent malic enzyme [Arenicellales bacterium WSBS_2016_MAG_OTU3]